MRKRIFIALFGVSLITNAVFVRDWLQRARTKAHLESLAGLPDPATGILLRMDGKLKFVPVTGPVPFADLAEKHFPELPRVSALLLMPGGRGDEAERILLTYTRGVGAPGVTVRPGSEIWIRRYNDEIPLLWTANAAYTEVVRQGIDESVNVSIGNRVVSVSGTTDNWVSSSSSGSGTRKGVIKLDRRSMEQFEESVQRARELKEPGANGLYWVGHKHGHGRDVKAGEDEVLDGWKWSDYSLTTILNRRTRELHWDEDWD